MNNWDLQYTIFFETYDKYSLVITEIKAKIAALESQKQAMQEEWNDLLLSEIEGEKHANIDTFQKKIAGVTNELDIQKSLLRTAEGRKSTTLTDLMPLMAQERNGYHNDVYNEVDGMSDNLKRKRCEFLLACAEISEVKAKGNIVEGQFDDCIRKAFGYVGDSNGYSKPRRKTYPMVNLHGTYGEVSEHLAPNTNESLQALNGKLPLFVIWYLVSGGELVTEREARRLLAERKKKEEEEDKKNG